MAKGASPAEGMMAKGPYPGKTSFSFNLILVRVAICSTCVQRSCRLHATSTASREIVALRGCCHIAILTKCQGIQAKPKAHMASDDDPSEYNVS